MYKYLLLISVQIYAQFDPSFKNIKNQPTLSANGTQDSCVIIYVFIMPYTSDYAGTNYSTNTKSKYLVSSM